MSLEFVGIGDLHLDGKLKKYLDDLNERILAEVEKVLDYARRSGIQLVVFYGDICETPKMSMEASLLFLGLLLSNPNFRFIIILGNHDKENAEHHSLQLFAALCRAKALPNVRIIEAPTTLFRKQGTPLRLLPWPFLDTEADALNVIHEAVSGSVWDHGRPVDGAKKVKHHCVAGHIHTKQIIGNVHFSGTLYQTSFGEKPNKYFHHVVWDGESAPSIKSVRHYPSFKLENLVVETAADLDKVVADPNHLYKVFVKSSVVLEADAFDGKPNVVKINSFKTKKELEDMIVEELRLDDEFDMAGVLSVESNLKGWLEGRKIEPELKRATYRKFKSLFGK